MNCSVEITFSIAFTIWNKHDIPVSTFWEHSTWLRVRDAGRHRTTVKTHSEVLQFQNVVSNYGQT